LSIVADGESMSAEIEGDGDRVTTTVDGTRAATDAIAVDAADAVYVLRRGRQTKVALRDLAIDEAGEQGGGGLVRAPMHGKVLAVFVEKGATVLRGQRLAIIEAMKMEHTLTAPIDGVVIDITVQKDAQVAENAKVMLIEPAAPKS
jgi:3-methylcrotonyl-CoA carboxylase alpha subunit